MIIEGNILDLKSYISLILTGNLKGPYYFVPLLVQLYLLAPILVRFAEDKWKWLLLITGIIQLISQVWLYYIALGIDVPFSPGNYLFPPAFFTFRIFWFALGITVGYHMHGFKLFLEKIKWIAFVSMIIFLIVGLIEWEIIFSRNHFLVPLETVIDGLYSISFIFAFLGFENFRLPLKKQVKYVGERSYGIYLAHVPAQEYAARLIYLLAPVLLGIQIIFLPMIFVAGFAIPIVLMEVMNRSPAQRYYKYVYG
jgi:peptidoglycan/LPS O-acetylase OafA/YrhL